MQSTPPFERRGNRPHVIKRPIPDISQTNLNTARPWGQMMNEGQRTDQASVSPTHVVPIELVDPRLDRMCQIGHRDQSDSAAEHVDDECVRIHVPQHVLAAKSLTPHAAPVEAL